MVRGRADTRPWLEPEEEAESQLKGIRTARESAHGSDSFLWPDRQGEIKD